VPTDPKTTFNVGRVGGGTSINAIPFEAWMEMDMRSADVESLKKLDQRFNAAVRAAVDEENRRWNNRGKISVSPELVGVRPAGHTPSDAPIVQTALAVSRGLGIEEALREGSTDSNVPMNMNLPAITISGGGRGSGAHSLNETFDTTGSWQGTQRAVLLAIALAR
jgi:acetylornithine deacetylase/succinyl-diaminopimelate desuccinylase-like protein